MCVCVSYVHTCEWLCMCVHMDTHMSVCACMCMCVSMCTCVSVYWTEAEEFHKSN